MESVSTILFPKWLIPMTDSMPILTEHALVIKDNRILAVLPRAEVQGKFTAKETIELPEHVLLPGLINAHTHSPMVLFRGMADDLPLMDWLQNHIWPAENKLLSEKFIEIGTELAIAEMIRSGSTCFNEHYFYPQKTQEVAIRTGMRAAIGLFFIDPELAIGKLDFLKIAKDFLPNAVQHELITFTLTPHSPYTVSDKMFINIKELQDKFNLPVYLHTHETAHEIQLSLDQYGKRPLKRLYDLGVLNGHTEHVHLTQVTGEDVQILKDTSSYVIHCPESNLKLNSGLCPVQNLLDEKIPVALGTDGAASNNDLDMFGEMKTAALIGKITQDNPCALSAKDTLYMATMGGAKAMNLAKDIGSLEAGKYADLIAVDLSDCNTQPVYNPISHLVYAVNSRQVSDVWVAGKRLLNKGQLTTIDSKALLTKVSNLIKGTQAP